MNLEVEILATKRESFHVNIRKQRREDEFRILRDRCIRHVLILALKFSKENKYN